MKTTKPKKNQINRMNISMEERRSVVKNSMKWRYRKKFVSFSQWVKENKILRNCIFTAFTSNDVLFITKLFNLIFSDFFDLFFLLLISFLWSL